MVNNLIILPIILPMAAGILTTLLRGQLTLQRLVGVSSICATAFFMMLLLAGLPLDGSPFFSMMGDWPAPFGIAIVVDSMSGVLLTVASIVALACYIHSFNTLDRRLEQGWFHPLFHFLLMGVNLSFLTGDLFNLFVAFEVMLMASYALLCTGATKLQLSHAYKYVMLNLIGSTIFVLGAGLLYGMVGTLNFADLARIVAESGAGGEPLPTGFKALAILFLLVFSLKAAVFPLWFWLPDTYPTVPTCITGLFAALLSKVGVYSIFRLFPTIFAAEAIREDSTILMILGTASVATMLLAIMGAIAAHHIRRILSLVLISHIGYLIFGVAVMTNESLSASFFYMAQEMVVISALFLCCGMIEKHAGTDDLSEIGGVLKRAPWLGVFFFIAAMGLVGIPPLSGFYGKAILIREGFASGAWMLSVAGILAASLTLFAVLKIWVYGFWSKPRGAYLELPEGAVVGSRPHMPAAFGAVVGLVTVSVGIGLFAEPSLQLTNTAAASLNNPRPYVEAILGHHSWPDAHMAGDDVEQTPELVEGPVSQEVMTP